MKPNFRNERIFAQLLQIGRIEEMEKDLLQIERLLLNKKRKVQMLRAIKQLYSVKSILLKDLYTYEKEGGDI